MRNKRLDVLRCIAVLLVLLRHGPYQTRVTAAGWVGVDLFFVLSGFLISGLLFGEYKKRGSIDFKRFLIRRGMKIYPAFYVLLVATFAYQVLFHQLSPLSRWMSEIFYMQNYGSPIWDQTWSLAVEEHFYILLPLFFLLLLRYSANRANPFQVIPVACLVVALTCLALRIIAVLTIPAKLFYATPIFTPVYATTHCRIDSLFFGVLLGYLHHFHSGFLDSIVSRPANRIMLIALSAALLSSCLMLPVEDRIMMTIGLTTLYLGFGIILVLCLRVQGILPRGAGKILGPLGTGFAYTGMFSYSIYLWHEAVQSWGLGFMRRIFHIRLSVLGSSIFYMTASIAFGILMSKLVEYPTLKLRDRLFPGAGTEALRATDSVGSLKADASRTLVA